MSEPLNPPPPGPPPVDGNVVTLTDLQAWLDRHCYSAKSYMLGKPAPAAEFGIIQTDDGYEWVFMERGRAQTLKRFDSETQAVLHALGHIRMDIWARRHLVGFVETATQRDRLIDILNTRHIPYFWDRIPYGGPDDPRFRIYVYGCDIAKAADLQAVFGVTP